LNTFFELEFFEFVCGSFVELELVNSAKAYLNTFGCINFLHNENFDYNFDFRFLYLLNSTIVSLEIADFVIFIGLNLRLEAPLINSRLRKNYKNSKFFSFGLCVNYLTFLVKNLGNSAKLLLLFLEGKLKFLFNFFYNFDLSFLN
jgi:hypothetical protein